MTGKEFLNAVSKSRRDIIQELLDALSQAGIDYCLIGGLAVNAYAEPVISLDVDLVLAMEDVDRLMKQLGPKCSVRRFEHSMNVDIPGSDLRIQIQVDPRYISFIQRGTVKNVMGYIMKTAAIEDVLQGKVWAYQDATRRKSKRQKDLADILRLVEVQPQLKNRLPGELQSLVE